MYDVVTSLWKLNSFLLILYIITFHTLYYFLITKKHKKINQIIVTLSVIWRCFLLRYIEEKAYWAIRIFTAVPWVATWKNQHTAIMLVYYPAYLWFAFHSQCQWHHFLHMFLSLVLWFLGFKPGLRPNKPRLWQSLPDFVTSESRQWGSKHVERSFARLMIYRSESEIVG